MNNEEGRANDGFGSVGLGRVLLLHRRADRHWDRRSQYEAAVMPTIGQELVPIEALSGGDTNFGPAMRQLPNDRMRKYVLIRVMQGKPNQGKAAELAGYGGAERDDAYLRVQGHRLEQNPHVQAAITEEALRQARHNLGSMLVRASERVGEVLESTKAKDGDTLKAAAMIFDRMGLHSISEVKKTVEHINDSPETIERVRRLAATLGLDAEKLLGSRLAKKQPVITDATYEEVPRRNPLKDYL